jgi:sporulation protein YlmC with PRC-barrel domain
MSGEEHQPTTDLKTASAGAWAAMSVRHAGAGHKSVGSDRMVYRPVFDHSGNLLGTITRLLIDRRSGHVDHVVVLTHGHFGFGRREVELPWAALGYDMTLPGYRLSPGATWTVATDG